MWRTFRGLRPRYRDEQASHSSVKQALAALQGFERREPLVGQRREVRLT